MFSISITIVFAKAEGIVFGKIIAIKWVEADKG